MSTQSKMTTCKHCGAEIAASAKACPKCGGKSQKPIYKRPWFIVLIVILVLGAVGTVTRNRSDAGTPPVANVGTSASPESAAPEISYTAYTATELLDDLDANALKAADKYKNQYVELTGRLNVIDSDGKYISIVPSDNEFAIIGIQCRLKTDEQKAVVMDLAIGDSLVVKGKITDVGEIFGYSLNIDEVAKAAD